MLVLTRRKDEVIDIGGRFDDGGIEIIVTEIRGDKVRLGIKAPKNVTVHRREITKAIQKNE